MSTYTRWYREGTVSIAAGSNSVIGTNTYWATAGLNPGDILKLGNSDYEIVSITDDTHLTLAGNYTGAAINGGSYAIVRNFTATMPAKIASKVSGLIDDFSKYFDSDHATLHGKSAYELAKANGYVGTESQWLASLVGKSAYEIAQGNGFTGTQAEWLESLIGAGKWSELDARTKHIAEAESNTFLDGGFWKNAVFRGKNLGSKITDEQLANIYNNTFHDLFLGDYWTYGGVRYRIVHFNYYSKIYPENTLDPSIGEKRWNLTGTTNDWGKQVHGKYSMPHVIVMPEYPIARGYYYDPNEDKNDDGTYASYYTCNWYRVIRPQCMEKFAAIFGEEHLLEWPESVPSGYDAEGVATGITFIVGRCELPTYRQIFGIPFVQTHGTKAGMIDKYQFGRFSIPHHDQFAIRKLTQSIAQNLELQFRLRDVYGLYNNQPCGVQWDSYTESIERSIFLSGGNLANYGTQEIATYFRPYVMVGIPFQH